MSLPLKIDAVISQFHRDKIGNPHKLKNKSICRVFINLIRGAHLPDPAVSIHDRHPVRNGQGNLLIVGHVEDGHPRALLKLFDLKPHLFPEVCIQVAEGLIEEHDLRLRHQGPCQGDPLLLPSGKLVGQPVLQASKVDLLQGTLRPGGRLTFFNPLNRQGVNDVLESSLMGPDGVVLKNDPDLSRLGGKMNLPGSARDKRLADEEIPIGRVLKTCNQPYSDCLPATGGTQKGKTFAVAER